MRNLGFKVYQVGAKMYNVLAVAVWCISTLVRGDLHEALLTGPTDS